MKKLVCMALIVVFWLTTAPAFAQGVRSGGATFPLTSAESQYLTYLREEEKLARDVYITLQQRWGLDIFVNISMSEQQHMDAIKNLLDKYGLADPSHPQIGVFTDQNLQMAYQALVARGNQSVVDALLTGGYIEELDLGDLEKAMAANSHSDLLQVYSNLMKGSRNHLRAFAGQLENSGIAYDAQVLTQDQVDAIINTPMERGGN